MRVLIIEDEARLARLLADALLEAGFAADTSGRLADAFTLVATENFDALIVDRTLPDGDALDLVAAVRRDGRDLPILMLTALDSIEDRVAGLEKGADDYLIKPFAMAELVARVRALLRRPGAVFGRIETIGNLAFDFASRAAIVDGRPLPLPRHELAVLEQLVLSARSVVTKDTLIDKAYGLDVPESNAIPVHVHHLRRRLEDAQATVRIHTFRGLGYMLAPAEAAT
jgi:two-component system, OmpR family, response regulator